MPSPPEILARLVAAFPRQPLTAETLRVYLRELDDVPPAAFDDAVSELTRTSQFFPTVSEIRETVAERTLGLPGEAAALEQVAARLSWARVDDSERTGDPPPIDGLVRQALDGVGGFSAFRTSDRPDVVRGQFLRLYRDLRSNAIGQAQLGTLALPPGHEQKRLDA